jgi:phospholipase C
VHFDHAAVAYGHDNPTVWVKSFMTHSDLAPKVWPALEFSLGSKRVCWGLSLVNKIRHLIVLMMENRSFDHYLGSLTLEGRTDVNGLPTPLPAIPDQNGNPVASRSIDNLPPRYPDPPHSWDASHSDYNAGLNDGFVLQYQLQHPTADPSIPMGYYTRSTLPVYYALADRFTVCDAWFSSVLSSTWPNRKYLNSGRRDEDKDTHALPPFPGFMTTPFYEVLENSPNPDLLGSNLTWKCYFSDLPFLGFWYRFAAEHAIHSFKSVDDFVIDCIEERLPTVSIIDPPFSLADDHPSHAPQLGQKFAGLIVDALTTSKSWETSALLLLYDENGGFFDHVSPPQAFEEPVEDNPLGFRVPALVVSPYAKKGFACHTVLDHTSVIKSINERWGVEFGLEFGTRWKQAPGIWDCCFDFDQEPIERGIYTGDPLLNINWGTRVHDLLTIEANPLEGMLERIFILPELKALDQRAQVFETLTSLEQRVISLKRMMM